MEEQVGFGAHKLELTPWATRAERLRRSREMLTRALNLRTTVAFLGSGCSAALGYPTWTQFTAKMVAHTLEVFQSGQSGQSGQVRFDLTAPLQRLKRFQQQLDGSAPIKSDQLLFMLGVCRQMFAQCEDKAEYEDYLKQLFQPPAVPLSLPNPYHALLSLDSIRRFITSNYDWELERALHLKRKLPEKELSLPSTRSPSTGRRRVFTQQHYQQLALFVMARVEEAENMIFHCHGSYRDPATMVVTEEDYQHWYLTDHGGAGTAFRQTLELLFGSNPILFIGFSLSDVDLLRPLRVFGAADQKHKHMRPLFALLPEKAEGEDWDYHEQLYDSYGVNVIPYTQPTEPQAWGQALCDALGRMKQDWMEGRVYWLKKPAIRKVEVGVSPPSPYRYYSLKTGSDAVFGKERLEKLLGELEQKAEAGTRVIALVGPGGTGKSWCAMRLLERLQQHSASFDGFFFWSSYYSDDSLTGLDRALSYLAPEEPRSQQSRISRLLKCLRQGRYFLVFDGIERFLHESEQPGKGRVYTLGITELLKVLADQESKSTVVLTSRLWPEVLEETDAGISRNLISLFSTDDLREAEPFRSLDRVDVSALCSLLDGHIYAIALAARMLEEAGENKLSCLSDLRRVLSDTAPDHRVSRMIAKAVEAVDQRWDGIAKDLLERLAIFMSPVTRQTIKLCYQLAVEDRKEAILDLDALIKSLVSSRLLYPVSAGPDELEQAVYTLHPIVRGYVFHRLHHAATDSLPNFTLPGFTAGTAVVDPGSKESAEIMEKVFNRLCTASEQAGREDRQSEARNLCRSAFGVVRSRMEANTVPRWSNYDKYLPLLIRLGDLAKNVSPRFWDYAEQHDLNAVEDREGVLYADELAWLYNELGLTYYSQSAMLDTLAVWEQEHEINRIVDSLEDGGQYLFQAHCNLGAANIHFGRLSVAEKHLKDAEKTNLQVNDPDHGGRITGYLALVQHLRGNLTAAEALYLQARKQIREAGENYRAESIFLRHQSDLCLQLDKKEEAKVLMDSSRALAETARYPDLIAYVRLSYGHWYRLQNNLPEALREYNTALIEARQIGIQRLEAEVLSELARLALDLGDAQIARQRAIESLRIANECVLGLRQTHGLVVLGLATLKAGERDLGVAYLKHAKKLADRQQYLLRGREAEIELQRLGESSNND